MSEKKSLKDLNYDDCAHTIAYKLSIIFNVSINHHFCDNCKKLASTAPEQSKRRGDKQHPDVKFC